MLAILYEDADLIVVDKPAGLVVHPSKDGEMSSLVGRVRLYLGHGEGRLVNRLDRETSGVVLLARHAEAAGELGRLIAAGAVGKAYTAVVHGAVTAPLTIEAPTGRDEASPVAIKDRVREDGAPAVTVASPTAVFERDGAPFTVLDVQPRTGRKHQIRIHLAHAGHPIVGDKLYGPDPLIYLRFVSGAMTPADEARMRLRYHALHARAMDFDWRGRRWHFEAPLREDLARFAYSSSRVTHMKDWTSM